jgi:muramidase (phage lysozyme)
MKPVLLTNNLAAFLSMVSESEGTLHHPLTVCKGYDVIVTGIDGPEIFKGFKMHPFDCRPPKKINNQGLYSTASGRYQILLHNYRAYKCDLSLPDFSPSSQDAIALQLILEKDAILDINEGRIETAIIKCANIWASLPGNNYGQHQNKLNDLIASFNKFI